MFLVDLKENVGTIDEGSAAALTRVTLGQLQDLSFGFLYSCAQCLDDALRNSLQSRKV